MYIYIFIYTKLFMTWGILHHLFSWRLIQRMRTPYLPQTISTFSSIRTLRGRILSCSQPMRIIWLLYTVWRWDLSHKYPPTLSFPFKNLVSVTLNTIASRTPILFYNRIMAVQICPLNAVPFPQLLIVPTMPSIWFWEQSDSHSPVWISLAVTQKSTSTS